MINNEIKKIAEDRFFAYSSIHRPGVAAIVCISNSERNEDGNMKKRRKKRRKGKNENVDQLLIAGRLSEAQARSPSRGYTMLNNKSRQSQAVIYKKLTSLIILIDLAFSVFCTDPQYRHHRIFYLQEGIASCIFMLEYIARLVAITEVRTYEQMDALK